MHETSEKSQPSEVRKFECLSIAAIVPRYNEEVAVMAVVNDLKAAIEGIAVYVYDNNSTGRTAGCRRSRRGRTHGGPKG